MPPRSSRPRSGLTRSGLGIVLAALATGFGGAVWNYRELVALAAGLIVFVGLAVGAVRLGSSTITVERIIDTPRVARGEQLRMRYLVANSARRATTQMLVTDQLADKIIAIIVHSIGAHDRIEIPNMLAAQRRGVFDIGPAGITTSDPFNLFVNRRSFIDVVGRYIVHPQVHRLDGPHGSAHSTAEEANIRSPASDPLSGFVSLREYVPGDDPRLIHWPTSAHLGTLMLREHVELRRPEFTVIIDVADEVGSDDDFEEMIDVAASVAVHALRGGIDVRVRTTDRNQPGTRRSFQRTVDVLDFLTTIERAQPATIMSLSELFGNDSIGNVVVITGPTGPYYMLGNPANGNVVRVGAGATDGVGVSLAVGTAAQFAQRWRS